MAELETTIKVAVDEESVAKAKKAVSKVSQDVSKQLSDIGRRNELSDLAKGFAEFEKDTKRSEDAVKGLTKQLELFGATDSEVKRVVDQFEKLRTLEDVKPDRLGSTAEIAGGASSGLSKIGSAVGALGGGSGLADLGDLVGGIESLKDFKGVLSEIGSIIPVASSSFAPLTAGITGLGGASAVALAAILPIAVALGAVAVAFANFQSTVAEAQKGLEDAYNANRSIQELIRSGTSLEDAKARAEELKAVLADEQANLAQANADRESAFAQLQEQFGVFGDLIARVAGLFGLFGPQAAEADKASEAIAGAENELKALTGAIEDNKFASEGVKEANTEAINAEDALAAARGGSAGATNDAQAKERANEQAQQRAQQEADRQAQQQAQAQEKAQKEAQDRAQKAADSAKKYSESLADVRKQYKESIKDAKKNLAENLKGLNDKLVQDLSDGQQKFNQEQIKFTEQRYRQEADALKDYNRKIEDINTSAFRSEEEAREGRNILQIAQLRKSQQQQLEDAQKEQKRGIDDRSTEEGRARQDARRDFEQARQDRRRDFERAQVDAQKAYQQDLISANDARRKGIESAQIARRRELEGLNQHLQGMLDMRTSFYQAEANAARQASGGGGGGNSRSTRPSRSGGGQSAPFNPFSNINSQAGVTGTLRSVGYSKR